VVAGRVERGFSSIALAGRRPEALEAFQHDCQAWAPQLQPLHWAHDGTALAEAIAACDLLVNTTPVGMASASNPDAAAACPLDAGELDALQASTVVYDIIYTPRPTRLLAQASQRGCRSIDGTEMLVQQGAAALRLWSGQTDVPVDVMRKALLQHLDGQ
jgi:shikimate dehydrogenase